MNTIPSTISTIDPASFAAWVVTVATINEEFSEVLRDTADVIAVYDSTNAITIYRLADRANTCAQELRQTIPNVPKPKINSWMIFGTVCVGIGALIDRLIRIVDN